MSEIKISEDKTKEILDSILSAQEKKEIEMFLERPAMVEALKKVLFFPITREGVINKEYDSDPNVNFLFGLVASQLGEGGMVSNEILGQDLRARWWGTKMLMMAFKDLENYRKKVELPKELKENKAR